MPRICIVALIGLPAAGKTTFCQQVLKMSHVHFNVVHLCADDFLPSISKSSNKHEPDFNYKKERHKIISLMQSLIDGLKSSPLAVKDKTLHKVKISLFNSPDYVILFDDNNYYTSMRYKVYQLCKKNQLHYGQIYFPIILKQAVQRNADRDKDAQVPEHIVEQMEKRLEMPNAHRHYWELQTLYLNEDDYKACYKNFEYFIANCFEHPIESSVIKTENSNKDTTLSQLHYLDIQLRHHIKKILDCETSTEVKKQKATILNCQRKEILNSFNKRVKPSLEEVDELCKLLTG